MSLSDMAMGLVVFASRWSCPRCRLALWIGGLALAIALALDADGCPHVLRVLLLFVDC